MSMKRKLLKLTFALFATMVCSSVNATTTSGTWGDNITWTLDNGVLTLSGTGAMYDTESWEREDYPWEVYDNEITSVVIEEGISSIATCAFESYFSLTSVSLPSSVTTIGWQAFYDCTYLASVNIPEGVTTLKGGSFSLTGLTTITIPSSVTNIGDDTAGAAFSGTNFTDIYCFASTTVVWGNASGEFPDGASFHVADNQSTWEGIINNVTVKADLTAIGSTNVGHNYWATYYNATNNYLADANTTVYKASLTGTTITLTAIPDKIINAGQAVILKSTSTPGLVPSASASATSYTDNELHGSDGTDVSDGTFYALAYQNSVLGFYKVNSGITIPAGKAYLKSADGARGFYGIDDDGTTAIKNMKVGKEDNIYYDLQGRRVLYPKKGLYILNGRKVIIK